MNEFSVEFDDLERDFENYLDMVINDGAVIIVTAEAVPLAAIVPWSLWERLQKAEEEIEDAKNI